EEELTPPERINRKLSSGLGEVIDMMMAKKRGKRYPSPEELIVDLECLLQDEPPRIACDRMASGALEALSEGEHEDAEGKEAHDEEKQNLMWWIYGLGGALALSVALHILRFIL